MGCLRVQPVSRASLKTRRPLGSVVLPAAGLLLEASSVQKRTGTPTQALGARRLGLQEEGQASVLVGGGVSALPPPFLKGDSDSTWTHMEEKQPHHLHTLGEGFLPAKNPPLPFGCPRAPPCPIKGGPRQPRKGMDRSIGKSEHIQGRTGSSPSRSS